MNTTPSSERLHIVLAGERNSGKSSLLNAIAGETVAIVSDVPGTTTDVVKKAIELPGLGACLLVDTAGLDDEGLVGEKRIEASKEALKLADVVLAVADAAEGSVPELFPVAAPVVPVLAKCDISCAEGTEALAEAMEERFGRAAVRTSAASRKGIGELIEAIAAAVPEDWGARRLTEGVVEDGDLVVLVMPQDSEAPKGRLILPQQQTIRELLDRRCTVVCCTPDRLETALAGLETRPKAIITDSQAFASVRGLTPEGVTLTSFSILMASSKGDIDYFRDSARVIDSLGPESRVLIAEACSHVPASEDIGRVKIPRILRSRAGEGLKIDFVSGRDFPEDLGEYDLIIHCGACMFNRRYVLSRIAAARSQGVPMTNYGVALAYINQII